MGFSWLSCKNSYVSDSIKENFELSCRKRENQDRVPLKQFSMDATKTCVLKIQFHCQCIGCENKIKKILQKIPGVYSIQVDAEQHKVTVLGTADPKTLIARLAKAGQKAEILSEQQPSPPPKKSPPPKAAPSPAHPPPPKASPPPPVTQPKKGGASTSAALASHLQQLVQFKGLKHVDLFQKRGIRLTFKDQNKDDKGHHHMKLNMKNGANGNEAMNHSPPPPPHTSHHEFNSNNSGAGPSGTKPDRTTPARESRPATPESTPVAPVLRPNDPFTTFLSDENPNACSVM